jgi:hypothetical protein
MHKRIRYRRIHLYPYDLTSTHLWSLPLASPNPTPLAPTLYQHKYRLPHHKIVLIALKPLPKVLSPPAS